MVSKPEGLPQNTTVKGITWFEDGGCSLPAWICMKSNVSKTCWNGSDSWDFEIPGVLPWQYRHFLELPKAGPTCLSSGLPRYGLTSFFFSIKHYWSSSTGRNLPESKKSESRVSWAGNNGNADRSDAWIHANHNSYMRTRDVNISD